MCVCLFGLRVVVDVHVAVVSGCVVCARREFVRNPNALTCCDMNLHTPTTTTPHSVSRPAARGQISTTPERALQFHVVCMQTHRHTRTRTKPQRNRIMADYLRMAVAGSLEPLRWSSSESSRFAAALATAATTTMHLPTSTVAMEA